MRVEIPHFTRCCCCLPLRQGILTLAYLKLIPMLLVLIEAICPVYIPFSMIYYEARGAYLFGEIAFMIYVGLEAIFNVILIIGCHKKNIRLLRIFYYYGIATILTSIILSCITVFYVLELVLVGAMLFSDLVIESMVLLLVRSEIKKLEQEDLPVRYVNKTAVTTVDAIDDRIYYPTVIPEPCEVNVTSA